MERRIQVVVGEAEPDAGWLRFVLEGEGFDVVGAASSDDELDRVLRGARPSVIVVDAGISALAAARALRRATEAALIVVWPEGVVAPLAEECVRPAAVVDRLGEAVRWAAGTVATREPPVDVAEELGRAIRAWRREEPLTAPVGPPCSFEPVEGPRRRRGRGVLVLAATWILILTVLATLAVSVPKVMRERDPDRPSEPRPTVVVRPPAGP
jgi:CheY-like chemotaxis protein